MSGTIRMSSPMSTFIVHHQVLFVVMKEFLKSESRASYRNLAFKILKAGSIEPLNLLTFGIDEQ